MPCRAVLAVTPACTESLLLGIVYLTFGLLGYISEGRHPSLLKSTLPGINQLVSKRVTQ